VITIGSLFSGIGGIDLGLERAGMSVKWQVEIDGFCRGILAKHWPDVERFEDVRNVGAHNLAAVDVVAGGFPCQDVSLAGKRAGLEGKRSTLWSEFARIIRELRWRWVLAENVPGLLSSDDGRFFGSVLWDLAASGYDAEWDCIPASACGAPQRRDRVWIVAHAQGLGSRHGMHSSTLQGAEPRLGLRRSATRCSKADTSAIVADCAGTSAFQMLRERGWQPGEPRRSGGGSWGHWAVEPAVGRVANGIPRRVDRLKALGNAVVPQVVELIGRAIMAAEVQEVE